MFMYKQLRVTTSQWESAVRKICDIFWEEHNMCCLVRVVQCSTKASHDDEVLPQFRELLRFFVRFDGNFSPSDNSSSNDSRKGEDQLKHWEDQIQVRIALSGMMRHAICTQKIGWIHQPKIDPIIHQPWIRSYCCDQWGWDSLLKRSQTVDVAFGGCLWSLATGDRILLKLEKISLIRQIYLEPYGSMMFNGTTVEDLKSSPRNFPHVPRFSHLPKASDSDSQKSLPGAIPMALKSDFSGSGFAMAVTTNGVRSVEIEATILPQLHSCRIKVKGLQPCTIFPACPEVLRFENSKDIKGIYGIYLYNYIFIDGLRWTFRGVAFIWLMYVLISMQYYVVIHIYNAYQLLKSQSLFVHPSSLSIMTISPKVMLNMPDLTTCLQIIQNT